nr:hypothetical protein [Tanacetum cinerariifolium]
MLDSEDSAVTYTSAYTDSEPRRVFWGTDEEVSEGGIPRVIIYGYDGFPIQTVPQDEDEREPRFIQAHDPDFVPEPVYPEYIPLEDEHVLPAEEQPLPPIDSPTIEISVRLQASVSLSSMVDVERLLALPTAPLSPLTSLSPPFAGEHLARLTDPSVHPS